VSGVGGPGERGYEQVGVARAELRVIKIPASAGDLVMPHGDLAVRVNNRSGLFFSVRYAYILVMLPANCLLSARS
jgi:hypothetical protein